VSWKSLTRFLRSPKSCTEKYFPEAAWNEAVHYPTLKLALKSFAGVEYLNVYDRRRSLILYLVQRLMLSNTTARVVPSLVPRHANGDILQSKIVDYTINLLANDEMEDMILRLLESQPYDLRTINQTMCDHVWYLPIAISIETKTPDTSEQEAKIRLGMWTAAQFNRLRMLLQEKCDLAHTFALVCLRPLVVSALCLRSRSTYCMSLLGLSCLLGSHILIGTAWAASYWRYELCGWLLYAARCSSLPRQMTTTFKEWLELKVLHPNAI
jgi:hypothetical protein